ncbi:ComF family protein [Prosthecomicrobium pneumaticum]|uniref:ComF family protein n=1 Tax=Prosthecomicrobium pneumaticum TaxID=81895 RepID=A0A7W9CVH9_9HYPH|nr:ComF family protein [Prosthecomicrobium pneumaticum]MBB5752464.1 ComF family protein [Prosthecomicrobium pneumaticum]
MDAERADLALPIPAARRLAAAFGRLGRGLADLVLPPTCLACDAHIGRDGALCALCWGAVAFIERPFCERLAIPFGYDIGPGALSAEAIADPPPFGRLRAVAVYDEISAKLVHGLKYRDRPELGRALGAMMVRAAADLAPGCELVLPVPLHPRRLWSRRFNQSALLAAAVAEGFGVAFEPTLLARIRPTRQQVRLPPGQRAENVRGAFAVPPALKPRLAGRRVVLVDDVYTTGATVKAATRALIRAGAASVDVAVFARVTGGRVVAARG